MNFVERLKMITKIKMLLGAFVLGIGLSGCIVIPDEFGINYKYYVNHSGKNFFFLKCAEKTCKFKGKIY